MERDQQGTASGVSENTAGSEGMDSRGREA